MRLAMCLFACLVLSASGLVNLIDANPALRASASANQLEPPSQAAPTIVNARLKGKKLFVSGENFTEGAEILIDGQLVKTKNDSDNPSTLLIAKKAGKTIPPETIVDLNVHTPEGMTSERFGFFSGVTITLGDAGRTIELAVGERFVLALSSENYEWAPTVKDSTIIEKVADAEQIKGAQGVFQALRSGQTQLEALGDLPCAKSRPPCLAPSRHFEVNLSVK